MKALKRDRIVKLESGEYRRDADMLAKIMRARPKTKAM